MYGNEKLLEERLNERPQTLPAAHIRQARKKLKKVGVDDEEVKI